MAEIVKTFDILVTVRVNDHDPSGDLEYRYDWTASNGAQSYELHRTAEDAEYDARGHFGF